MGSFIREKKTYYGDYMDAAIYQMETGRGKGPRGKKEKKSSRKQKNLNDKNAKNYFRQILHANFGEGDYHIVLTYSDKYLPLTPEGAEKETVNYLNRLKYHCKKQGLPQVKYLVVLERGKKTKRLHHHIILKCQLPRDKIEELWSKRKKGGKEKIGWINADRLQPDEEGLNELCSYLTKDPQGKKRWSCSHNLDKPKESKNDWKYSKRQVKEAAGLGEDREYWEKKYPGYRLLKCKSVYNEITGWSINLRFRKKE